MDSDDSKVLRSNINNDIATNLTIFDSTLSKPFHGFIWVISTVVHCVTPQVIINAVLVCTLEMCATRIVLLKIWRQKIAGQINEIREKENLKKIVFG